MEDITLVVANVVDSCIKTATISLDAFRQYRSLDNTIDVKLALLEASWKKIEEQLVFLRKISEYLTEALAESQLKLLEGLNCSLGNAISRIETSSSGGGGLFRQKTSDVLKRFRISMVKNVLQELVVDLEAWQNRFDPTWYLVILISNTALDNALIEAQKALRSNIINNRDPVKNILALRSIITPATIRPENWLTPKPSVNLDPNGFKGATILDIPFSTAKFISRLGTANLLIGEAVPCVSGFISQVKSDVENLARRLQRIDPESFSLLQCYGLVKHKDVRNGSLLAIDVIYRAPMVNTPPRTLRAHLLDQNLVSISTIINLAKQLVRSVSYIHACNFVHKNIRPENILIFPNAVSQIGTSFLVGFNQFRDSNLQTNMLGDVGWHRNLYRHPQRQGLQVQNRYIMQHDIYSLGVCLLEIGLWRCFVWYPELDPRSTPVASIQLGFNISNQDFEVSELSTPLLIQERLIALAKRELPCRVGDLYTEAVLLCLTCLDPGSDTFGDDDVVRDRDGIIVGIRFVEGILSKLYRISI